jgi:hypothetical protein
LTRVGPRSCGLGPFLGPRTRPLHSSYPSTPTTRGPPHLSATSATSATDLVNQWVRCSGYVACSGSGVAWVLPEVLVRGAADLVISLYTESAWGGWHWHPGWIRHARPVLGPSCALPRGYPPTASFCQRQEF